MRVLFLLTPSLTNSLYYAAWISADFSPVDLSEKINSYRFGFVGFFFCKVNKSWSLL